MILIFRILSKEIEGREILGESMNVAEYLSKQLNWNESTLNEKQKSFPVLFRYNIQKVENHLNFLQNEAGYTVDDINSNIFIFRSNFEELKHRFHELTKLDHRPKLYELSLARKLYLDRIKIICKRSSIDDKLEILKNCELRLKSKN